MPQQSRSLETCSNILQAAAELFAEPGYDQTTTHQLAARAGVSVGALYRYFADKQAILIELYRVEISDLRQRVLAAFDPSEVVGQDLPKLARQTVALALQLYSRRPKLRRELDQQSRKIPTLIDLRARQDKQVQLAVQHLLASVPGVRLPDLEAAAYLITTCVDRLLDDYMLNLQAQAALDQERVLDAAVDMIVHYALGHTGSERPTQLRGSISG